MQNTGGRAEVDKQKNLQPEGNREIAPRKECSREQNKHPSTCWKTTERKMKSREGSNEERTPTHLLTGRGNEKKNVLLCSKSPPRKTMYNFILMAFWCYKIQKKTKASPKVVPLNSPAKLQLLPEHNGESDPLCTGSAMHSLNTLRVLLLLNVCICKITKSHS